MYQTVYFEVGLTKIISLEMTKFQLEEYYRVYLLDHGRMWSFDPVRRAFLAVMIARLAWATRFSRGMAIHLMNSYNDIVADNMNQYVKLFKHGMRDDNINTYIFAELIADKLEIGRRERVTLDADIAMFTTLNCLFTDWNSTVQPTMFNADLLGLWCSVIANVSLSPGLEVTHFLHKMDSTLLRQLIRRSHADVYSLGWTQQRKRKREITKTVGTCGICFDENIAVHQTRCGHDFCPECLGKWTKPTCPTCRGFC